MHVIASGRKTARVVQLLFEYGVWVGWGGVITFMRLAYTREATLLLRHWLGFGWGNNVHVTCVHAGRVTMLYVMYMKNDKRCPILP